MQQMMEDILVPTTAVWDVVVEWFTHCEPGYTTAHTSILPDGTAAVTGEKLLSIDLTEENRVTLLRQGGSFAQERAEEFQSKRREKLARQKDKTHGKVPGPEIEKGSEKVKGQGLGVVDVETVETGEVMAVAVIKSSLVGDDAGAVEGMTMTTDTTTGSVGVEVGTGLVSASASASASGVGSESVDVSQLPESSLPVPVQSRTERRLLSFGRNQTKADKTNNETTTTTTATAANNSNANATAVKSFRHQLQEYCQKRGHPNPIYETRSIGTLIFTQLVFSPYSPALINPCPIRSHPTPLTHPNLLYDDTPDLQAHCKILVTSRQSR